MRQNAHQSLRELSAMAYAVLVAASARFLGSEFADTHASGSIALPPQGLGEPMEMRRVPIAERPALLQQGDTVRGLVSQRPRAARWMTPSTS